MSKIKRGYKELDTILGDSLEQCVNKLVTSSKCYLNFNGHILYSDTTTMDSAYLAITGLNKRDHDAMMDSQHQAYKEARLNHKARIPALTDMYVEKGKKLIDPFLWDEWEQIVPIRLSDIYEGMELDATLTLIEMLNNNDSFSMVKQALDKQNHSGMSHSLVVSMVSRFHKTRGREFMNFIIGGSL